MGNEALHFDVSQVAENEFCFYRKRKIANCNILRLGIKRQ